MRPLVAILLVTAAASCSDRSINPPSGDNSIPFELIVPRVAGADYLAVSGVRVITNQVIIDTLVDRTTGDLYARFITTTGVPRPASVTLNSFPVEPFGSGDTMGLVSEGWSGLGGVHKWSITDSAGRTEAASVAPVDLIDTVFPFTDKIPIRTDVPLTIRWRPATLPSDGVLVTWRMPGVETYQVITFDVGTFSVPADTVLRFRGENGEISLTRFKATRFGSVLGRTLQTLRLAQRSFATNVSG